MGYTIYRYTDKGVNAFDDDYDEVNVGLSIATSDSLSFAIDYAIGENKLLASLRQIMMYLLLLSITWEYTRFSAPGVSQKMMLLKRSRWIGQIWMLRSNR